MIMFQDLLSIEDSSLDKLTTTTKLTGNETEPAWLMVHQLYKSKSPNGKGHLFHNLSATLINSCLTELKINFRLSRSILEALLKQDWHIERGTISGKELNVFFAKAKAAGMITELEEPSKGGGSGAKAGLYRIEIAEIAEYINQKLSKPLSFFDALPTRSIDLTPAKQIDEAITEEVRKVISSEIQNQYEPNNREHEFEPGDELVPTLECKNTIPLAKERFILGSQNLPSIGSKHQDWADFGATLCASIRSSKVPLFNAWGDYCGDWIPEVETINDIVRQSLMKRFKDKTGPWAIDGEIAQSASSLILKMTSSVIEREDYVKPRFRNCSPHHWAIYNKTDKIIEAKKCRENEFLSMLMNEEQLELANQVVTNDELLVYEAVKANINIAFSNRGLIAS